jgi:dTDP-4-amino-4,6-dideoxygalactose transaminase
MTPIPLVDLPAQVAALEPALSEALARVLRGGALILGPEVASFEQEAAAYLGCTHTIGCASGTDALHLALRALGVGPGDEVITTPFTFIATAEAIVYTGARPRFVDIDPRTFTLDPQAVADALTPQTRAVLPVHLFGQPADTTALQALCAPRGIAIVEDAAQAFGASIEGQKVGAIGQIGCFSLYPTKNLGAFGDGGLLSTSDPALAAQLRLLREHGHEGGYRHSRLGYNSRLDALQAAVLRLKLPRLDAWNARRRAIAARYDAGLRALGLEPPFTAPGRSHVYHQYSLRCPNRDGVRAAMAAQGVATAVYYPLPLHLQPSLAPYIDAQRLPIAEQAAATLLSLPIHPFLCEEAVERVLRALEQALRV